MTESLPDFTWLPDLALRSLGGAVIWANDEVFAEKENLISPGPSAYRPASFGHKGQVYDGWETRRRRDAGHDTAIVRLGVPGVIRGVVVDTAWFKGNYPPAVSVDAIEVDGYPTAEQLAVDPGWVPLIERSRVYGDTRNNFEVSSEQRWTHVRLNIYPDGGVARLRVHGEGRPDKRFLGVGPVDLAALENGGLVLDCSNRFYSSPQNLIFPGQAQVMGDGWETARRRDDANDWVRIRLAGPGRVRLAEIDTSYFIGNSPGAAALTALRADGQWIELLPRTELLPDTRHRFLIDVGDVVSEARLDIYPDGGLARLRLFGELA
ncbi:allantoicase [Mycolicibacterium aubagnense]|uniref:Probable allantoicase n=1 Tax=Mycolicibacterium aubagnense TaxID=319707 RepID=A0ABM7IHI7_9MYCO|nr:allantoicase [Mycolicibacterium aubagnense]TLH69056.1 allantoicase [Mycolicibacterium aubagnense]WGI32326.1 allantoicase [Mycolicibacterium aubagnense]BBX86106.1 putative allantoicase [Mycolicibacterium aubagnense]